ncbi:MAG: hypothetical protein H2069_10450 [Legionella sp.]|nr:hypothetical protein [Legionella sp.]
MFPSSCNIEKTDRINRVIIGGSQDTCVIDAFGRLKIALPLTWLKFSGFVIKFYSWPLKSNDCHTPMRIKIITGVYPIDSFAR